MVEATGANDWTATQSLTDERWSKVKDKMSGKIYYKLMLRGVGVSLIKFSSTRQLVITMRDYIKGTTMMTTAFGDALRLANILYRGISVEKKIVLLNGDS